MRKYRVTPIDEGKLIPGTMGRNAPFSMKTFYFSAESIDGNKKMVASISVPNSKKPWQELRSVYNMFKSKLACEVIGNIH